ncbi:DUF58 domain-containing protein [Paenibacillus sp. N1-5-1-14]|uniref:DUF58 domain-containing protein n=1 Tax=Paenibacillus radicibacter TaxID=2972488 RepID=UPI002159334B|nr:DUF58 domain-containing protein [Paenibacillus radicibacter]MCR8643031.1 DUF58 domain-containing protein [Paenibacillus radicibacter]
MRIGGKWLFLLVMSAIWLTISLTFGGVVSWFLTGVFGLLFITSILFPLVALIQVEVSHTLSTNRIQSGTELFVSLDIKQRSLIPLPWLIIQETWQHEGGSGELEFRQLVFPWFYSRLNSSYVMNNLHRGTYRLVHTELITGDFLGFTLRKRKVDAKQAFLVTPKAWLGQWVDNNQVDGEGQRLRNLSMPTYHAARSGIREYVQGDPMHAIHWKASAKTGKWFTKDRENTQSRRMLLVLDGSIDAAHIQLNRSRNKGKGKSVVKYAPVQPMDHLFERRVELTAGILQEAKYTGREVRFATNALQGDAASAYFMKSKHMGIEVFSEGLAYLHAGAGISFADLLIRESAQLDQSMSLVCVTSTLNEYLAEVLLRWNKRNQSVQLYMVHDPQSTSRVAIESVAFASYLRDMGCQVSMLEHTSIRGGEGDAANQIS